jgi:superfamily II DNA helicase RecQ
MGKDLRSQMVHKGNQFDFGGPTIVYCATKKSAEKVIEVLKCKFSFIIQVTLMPL